jgi:hypothetical protein
MDSLCLFYATGEDGSSVIDSLVESCTIGDDGSILDESNTPLGSFPFSFARSVTALRRAQENRPPSSHSTPPNHVLPDRLEMTMGGDDWSVWLAPVHPERAKDELWLAFGTKGLKSSSSVFDVPLSLVDGIFLSAVDSFFLTQQKAIKDLQSVVLRSGDPSQEEEDIGTNMETIHLGLCVFTQSIFRRCRAIAIAPTVKDGSLDVVGNVFQAVARCFSCVPTVWLREGKNGDSKRKEILNEFSAWELDLLHKCRKDVRFGDKCDGMGHKNHLGCSWFLRGTLVHNSGVPLSVQKAIASWQSTRWGDGLHACAETSALDAWTGKWEITCGASIPSQLRVFYVCWKEVSCACVFSCDDDEDDAHGGDVFLEYMKKEFILWCSGRWHGLLMKMLMDSDEPSHVIWSGKHDTLCVPMKCLRPMGEEAVFVQLAALMLQTLCSTRDDACCMDAGECSTQGAQCECETECMLSGNCSPSSIKCLLHNGMMWGCAVRCDQLSSQGKWREWIFRRQCTQI